MWMGEANAAENLSFQKYPGEVVYSEALKGEQFSLISSYLSKVAELNINLFTNTF